MKTTYEKIKRIGGKTIDTYPLLGVVPFVGGIALGDYIADSGLPSLVHSAFIVASGVLVHRKAHEYFGTEMYFTDEDGPPLGFRLKESPQPVPHSSEQPQS